MWGMILFGLQACFAAFCFQGEGNSAAAIGAGSAGAVPVSAFDNICA